MTHNGFIRRKNFGVVSNQEENAHYRYIWTIQLWSSGSFQVRACVIHVLYVCWFLSFFLFSFFRSFNFHLHCNAFHAVAATLRRHAQSFGRKKKFTCRLLHRIRKYSNTFAWTFRYNDPRCVLLPNYTRWTHNFAKHIFILASTSQFIICRCHFLMAVINIYVGHACILQSNLLEIL